MQASIIFRIIALLTTPYFYARRLASDEYTIPCDHAGGTFWYHPHHHGSTSLQMGGGAMGALIIEDRADVHAIPDQIANMPEIVLTIQVTVSTFCFQLPTNQKLRFVWES